MGQLTFSNQKLKGNFDYTDGEYSAQGEFTRDLANISFANVNAFFVNKGEKVIGNAYITFSNGVPDVSMSVTDYSEIIGLATTVAGLVAAFAEDDNADA